MTTSLRCLALPLACAVLSGCATPGAQRQDSHGQRLRPKRVYSLFGTDSFFPVPSPFQWNWLLAYTSPSVRKSVP